MAGNSFNNLERGDQMGESLYQAEKTCSTTINTKIVKALWCDTLVDAVISGTE